MSEDPGGHGVEGIPSWIRQRAHRREFRISIHARTEMDDEHISTGEVMDCLMEPRILENYPDHQRGPCCLVYGESTRGRELHVVCTTQGETLIVITTYEPRMPWWRNSTERNRS